jgi:hypothetical protein
VRQQSKRGSLVSPLGGRRRIELDLRRIELDLRRIELDQRYAGALPLLSLYAVVTAFGRNQQDVTAASAAIGGFLTAREAFQKDDSTKNRLMTPEQKLEYGVITPDPKPTPRPRPSTVPEADADTSIGRQVTIPFWDKGSTSRQAFYSAEPVRQDA